MYKNITKFIVIRINNNYLTEDEKGERIFIYKKYLIVMNIEFDLNLMSIENILSE
jgi:hypothetical protein